MKKNNSGLEVLISEKQIKKSIKNLAKEIDLIYDGNPILLVGILKGSFIFMSDLAREVNSPCEIDFMVAKSYEGEYSSGQVNITLDLKRDISNYHVIMVEDIIDTGRTLKAVSEILKSRNPLSYRVFTLLDKPSRRVVDFSADKALFTIPDLFVVGYGLDCDEKFRNLKNICVYKG